MLKLLSAHARFFNDRDLETADFDVNWDHNGSRWFNVRLFTPKLYEETKLLDVLEEFSQSLSQDYAIWVDCDYCNVDDDDEDAPLIEVIILRDRMIAEPCPEEFADDYINNYGFSRTSLLESTRR
ncbi:MAG: hypothetical protein MI744_01075 [Pseudomonadales bacterium]|nr:hypothetical protein [Pseudomonadales bacterium]